MHLKCCSVYPWKHCQDHASCHQGNSRHVSEHPVQTESHTGVITSVRLADEAETAMQLVIFNSRIASFPRI